MDFFKVIKICFKKYADFSGRASRTEFWNFFAFLVVLQITFDFIDSIILGVPYIELNFWDGYLGNIFYILTFVPGISVSARRLHDINKSGWWMLIVLTVIGSIPLIYWYCKKGEDKANKYGPNSAVFKKT